MRVFSSGFFCARVFFLSCVFCPLQFFSQLLDDNETEMKTVFCLFNVFRFSVERIKEGNVCIIKISYLFLFVFFPTYFLL